MPTAQIKNGECPKIMLCASTAVFLDTKHALNRVEGE